MSHDVTKVGPWPLEDGRSFLVGSLKEKRNKVKTVSKSAPRCRCSLPRKAQENQVLFSKIKVKEALPIFSTVQRLEAERKLAPARYRKALKLGALLMTEPKYEEVP